MAADNHTMDGFMQILTPQATSCSLHPVVMFEVLDHYTRRNVEDGRPLVCKGNGAALVERSGAGRRGVAALRGAGRGRVVGALLGSVNTDGSVALKNSFAMPHDI
ncbi:hypothetical protein T484DRAFT_1822884, partial [Baffinella frigidus]